MTPIMNQYAQIKKEHKDSILLFRLGDFYELFYEDALIAVDILKITLTKRKQKEEEIPMAGFPAHASDHYIASLVKSGHKVAVCEQVQKELGKGEKIIKREVVRIITQGTVFEDELIEDKRNSFLVSLFFNGIMVYISKLDLSTNEFEFEEIETANLSEFLEKIDPNEILVIQNQLPLFQAYDEYKNKISFSAAFSKDQSKRKVEEFYGIKSSESISSCECDLISVCMVLDYIESTQKNKVNLALPKKRNAEKFLYIDKYTRRNLELTKTLQGKKEGSLLSLIDKTKTAQGARLLFNYLNNPLNCKDTLNNRYEKVSFFIKKRADLDVLREVLKNVPDFERLLGKIVLNIYKPAHLVSLATGIMSFYEAMGIIKKESNQHADLANLIIENVGLSESEFELISAGFDAELDSWRDFLNELSANIEELQDFYRNKTKIATLRIKKHLSMGYLIEIPSSQKSKLGYEFSIRQDLKSTARYISEDLEGINVKIFDIAERINQRQSEIIEGFAKKIVEIKEDLVGYAKTSAELDVFSNFAYLSLENDYCKPEISESNVIDIRNGKNPILDVFFKKKGKEFVPNDCVLNGANVVLMTGPNMAGKSTYLRQQALIIILAQIGMYVPAESAKIGLVDRVFSRIGTNDNLLEGNSTFMVEMIETALAINQASESSFIIFDEVGRGTSTEEGFALAKAILEDLLEKNIRSIFATHYLELGKLDHINLQKKMMEILDEPGMSFEILFKYKAVNGAATHSYAFNVAQIAGLPAKIIERAREIFEKL